MMMTGSCGACCLIWRSNSNPDWPGIRMSLTITAGCCAGGAARNASNACAAWVKLCVGNDSRCNARSSTKRIDWSSSTIQMGRMGCLRLSLGVVWAKQWQDQLKYRAARHAVAGHHAVVLLYKALGQREA